ncbi:MAG: DUF6134 family protein [Alphaproteobacteria bacterium]
MKKTFASLLILSGLGLSAAAIADSAEKPAPEPVSGGEQPTDRWVPADGENLTFKVIDGRKTIGELTLDFAYDDDGVLTIVRDHQFQASRFFMSFSMDQDMTSKWRDNKLVYMKNDMFFDTPMGDQDFTFEAEEGQYGDLHAQTEAGPRIIPGDAYPETFWNSSFFENDRFFRAYLGSETTPQFRKAGVDYVTLNGEDTTCVRYDVTTQNLQGEDQTNQYWFEQNGRLCQMAFTNPAGTFYYKRD